MPGSSASLLSAVDSIVGDGVEAAVRAKHSWRLRRLGWSHALAPPDDGPWAAGDPLPRGGCSLEVLVDGAEAFPQVAEAIENARDYVHVTGWHVAPYFELVRGTRPGVLGELLAEAAERLDVRVLVWAGAPVPAFHPARKEVRDAVGTLTRDTRIRCETDPREHPFHCHHEKTVIVDGEVAFVGGIDMTDYAGDRFDTSDHPARRRLGWHDVGTRLRGPVVADVDDHFALRWHELTGEQLERPARTGARRRAHGPGRADDRQRHVRRGPGWRVPDPRELRARDRRRPALHLPREPVPVVPGDRPAARGQAAPAAVRRVPDRDRAPGEGEQRARRHDGPARRAGRGR